MKIEINQKSALLAFGLNFPEDFFTSIFAEEEQLSAGQSCLPWDLAIRDNSKLDMSIKASQGEKMVSSRYLTLA